MHSFLLISTDEKRLTQKSATLCEERHISPFDQTVLQKEKNIGIEDIRILQKNLSLAPLQSPEKAAIVYNADTMSIDAQNAFLKTLEEPPAHTILILLAKDKEAFLPTVLSRCSIEELDMHQTNQTIDFQPIREVLDTVLKGSIGSRLAAAEKIAKTKDTALQWTINAQRMLRDDLITTQQVTLVPKIRKLQNTQKLLANTNANTRAVLEQLFLSL